MEYRSRDLERITKTISSNVEEELEDLGLLFRIFYRCKSDVSTINKLSIKKYDGVTSFMRDIIGIRINLYFADDLEIVYNLVREKFEFVEETIDKNEETEFKPTRINIIYRIPKEFDKEFVDVVNDKRIDNTFELQLRTVLSEGWHEVDHDLRYKCLEDWEHHAELSRVFNGILASLETNDWSILKLFEQLSFLHYKSSNWPAMIRTKYRIRFVNHEINPELLKIIASDLGLQKQLFRIDRNEFLNILAKKKLV